MMSTEGDGSTGASSWRDGVVSLAAGPIHFREAGEGPPIVFVHGFGVNGTLWRGPAASLAASHRVILPDLPFGSHPEPIDPDADLSPPGAAAIVADLLAALELDQVTLVGNDSGGAVCQILATERPERISRMVLTNCDCLEAFPPGVFKLLVAALKLPGGARLITQGMRFDLNRRSPLAYGSLSRTRLSDELLDSWTRPMIENRGVARDARKFGSGMHPRHTLAAAEKLPLLEIPVLLAWGEADRFFKIELAERLADLIPDARLVRFEDSLTFVPIDEPEHLASEIAGFVAATAAGLETEAGAGR